MAKPKKKQVTTSEEKETTSPSTTTKSSSSTNQYTKSIFSDSPVYELLHYFEKAPDQWAARYILILTAIILRTAIGLGGHSGYATPPMFGDFEAQRHWMEITINLPLSQWYYFDLEYWGLDYPPLTAYHSYIIGLIGGFINGDWFALDSSRGIETDELRFFMRFMAIVSELIIYIPAVLSIANMLGKKFNVNRMDQIIISLVIINQAHLVLIDHGHFQFNSVMLGLFVYSVIDLAKGNLILASIWFVSCINFKQMGLYYSLFIFFYILSQLNSFSHLISVGITVVATQIVYLLPFIIHKPESILQIVHRVFPLGRGLFEDKVANFWCTTNTIIKYRDIIDPQDLPKLALLATLVATVPINILLFFKLRKKPDNIRIPGMIYGFAINSLSFYLFSFQVHEKSILVPLIPISLLLLIDHNDINMIQWVNNVGTFSLYPLLKKDDLIMQYFVSNLLINWLIGPKILLKSKFPLNNIAMWSTYAMMIIYHLLDSMMDPPVRYPDLWVILNITISFIGFAYFWLWLVYKVYKL
ncbi:ALG6 [[Candida] subhashii]|uniref:Alpha-1,3-glucosyltransferase n=1 Tax=[Candida] subhashii TaxID=561895 RepID=A0A8J5QEP3_9ASCO|nr:ALG6 [[Candida] subhashii]KAG7661632.1 ALG6 [[Candida] subhashii]